MLAIRLQRVGRKGNAIYRIIVQEAQKHPTSGRIVASLGNYNPHTKESNIQADLAQKYLDNGAQPSPRVTKLLEAAKVKLPKWVKSAQLTTKSIKNLEKLRKNRPAKEGIKEEAPVDEPKVEAEKVEIEEPVASVETTEVVDAE